MSPSPNPTKSRPVPTKKKQIPVVEIVTKPPVRIPIARSAKKKGTTQKKKKKAPLKKLVESPKVEEDGGEEGDDLIDLDVVEVEKVDLDFIPSLQDQVE